MLTLISGMTSVEHHFSLPRIEMKLEAWNYHLTTPLPPMERKT
jgi:hypothetical protein